MSLIEKVLNNSIFGLLLGSTLTFIITFLINKLRKKDELNNLVAEKRINAYEDIFNLLAIANITLSPTVNNETLNNCNLSKYIDSKHESAFCFSRIFESKQIFFEYKNNFSNMISKYKLYFHSELFNKLTFFDSYIGEVYHLSNNIEDLDLQYFGYVLKNEIEKLICDCDEEIQKFINGKYKKKNFVSNYQAYDYETKRYKDTFLYKLFIKKGSKNQICNDCSNEQCSKLRNRIAL